MWCLLYYTIIMMKSEKVAFRQLNHCADLQRTRSASWCWRCWPLEQWEHTLERWRTADHGLLLAAARSGTLSWTEGRSLSPTVQSRQTPANTCSALQQCWHYNPPLACSSHLPRPQPVSRLILIPSMSSLPYQEVFPPKLCKHYKSSPSKLLHN
jgi:hypothetical protein